LFETNKKPADKQKLRGGYYTPSKLADFLVNWAVRDGTERILEPSAGNGNFVVSATSNFTENIHITAVEIDQEEIEKAQNRVNGYGNVSMSSLATLRLLGFNTSTKESERLPLDI